MINVQDYLKDISDREWDLYHEICYRRFEGKFVDIRIIKKYFKHKKFIIPSKRFWRATIPTAPGSYTVHVDYPNTKILKHNYVMDTTDPYSVVIMLSDFLSYQNVNNICTLYAAGCNHPIIDSYSLKILMDTFVDNDMVGMFFPLLCQYVSGMKSAIDEMMIQEVRTFTTFSKSKDAQYSGWVWKSDSSYNMGEEPRFDNFGDNDTKNLSHWFKQYICFYITDCDAFIPTFGKEFFKNLKLDPQWMTKNERKKRTNIMLDHLLDLFYYQVGLVTSPNLLQYGTKVEI